MSKWIWTSDKYPDEYENVITIDRDGNMFIAYYDGETFVDNNINMDDYSLPYIIAWTPIPEIDINIPTKDMLTGMELGNMLFGNSRGNYHIDRDPWQDVMVDILEALDCDAYGLLDKGCPYAKANDSGGVTTEHFVVRPYYWGDDEDIAVLPNFEYRCDDTYITIDWYKYPLRDSYSNVEISKDMWKEMLEMAEEEYTL